jgi:hypothetical protein
MRYSIVIQLLKNSTAVVSLAVAISILGVTPRTVFAGVLYSTSYEAPTYSVGPLSGQDGWLNSFDIDPKVISGFARTGSQSLEIRQAAGENPYGLTFRVGPYSTSLPQVIVEHSIYLAGSVGWTPPSTFFSPLALNGANGFISQIAVRDGTHLDFFGEVTPIETDRWIDLKLVLDFPTQTSSAFINGTFVDSKPFASAATELLQVEIFHIFDNTNFDHPGPSNSVFLDDLRITSAVPEPSSLALLAAAGFCGAIVVARRRAAAGKLGALRVSG